MRDRNIQRRNYQNNASMKNFRKTASLPMRVLMSSAIALSLSSIPIDIPLLLPQHKAVAQVTTVEERRADADRLHDQGLQQLRTGQLQEALEYFNQALVVYQEIRDRARESRTIGNLGITYRDMGEYERAIKLLLQYVAMNQELSNRAEEGFALGHLGIAYRESGQYELAIDVLEQRIEIAREVGDRSGEGAGLGNLGLAYAGLGQYERAIEIYEQRLDIARELGERGKESLTLGNLAGVYLQLGQTEQATELLQQSLEIAQEINRSDLENLALEQLRAISRNNQFSPLEVTDAIDGESETISLVYNDGTPDAQLPANSYEFQGLADQTIYIHVKSEEFQPNLLLVDREADRSIALTDWVSTSTGQAWLILTLPTDSTYSLQVIASEATDRGTYQLTIDTADQNALVLAEANNLQRQADQQYRVGAYRDALHLSERALELYRQEEVQAAFPEISRQREAIILGNIGNAYNALGDYERAIDFQKQSIDLKRRIDNRQSEAFSLDNLGNTYSRLRDYENAVNAYQQALAIWQETENHSGEANSLERLGSVYRAQYQYERAIELYEQLLAIKRETNDLVGEVDTLINIGLSYKGLGQYEQAIDTYQQALIVARESNNQQQEVDILGSLGSVYRSYGDIQQATKFFMQALELSQNINDRRREAAILGAFGGMYSDINNYSQAIDTLQRGLRISQEINDQDREASILITLGVVYQALGQRQQAIDLYGKSLEIARAIDDRRSEAIALSNLAHLLTNENRLFEAFDFHNQSAEIALEINDKEMQAESWLRSGSWRLYQGYGSNFNPANQIININIDEALNDYLRALALYREIDHQGRVGVVLNSIGNLYSFIGEHQAAIRQHEESLTIFREIGNPSGEVSTLVHLGAAYQALRQYPNAEEKILEALALLDTLRDSDLSEADRIALFEAQKDTYSRWESILLSQGKTEEALVASERARARVLVDSLNSQISSFEDNVTAMVPSLAEIRQIAQQQNATLVSYSISDLGTSSDQIIDIWLVRPTGEVVFRSVDPGPAFPPIEWVEDEAGGYVGHSQSDEGITNLKDLISNSREIIGARGRSPDGTVVAVSSPATQAEQQAQQRQTLQELYKLLIEPIAAELPTDPNEHVIFIPHQELFLVPFAALMNAEGEYLIENHTIRTAPSIQVLGLTHQLDQQADDNASMEALIVGNPIMPEVWNPASGSKEQLSSLTGAEDEAVAIAELFDTQPLLWDKASEATVRQQMPQAQIIHLATHGLLEYGDPQESGVRDFPGAIALAPSGTDDGLLTSAEIQQMDLNADLVVLSACDTGRGRISGDGVIGLSRSLITAGVPSVVVSLWQVPDQPTAFLMKEFYQNLQHTPDKAQALRQAMLTTMETHPEPINWAAFTLIGEAE